MKPGKTPIIGIAACLVLGIVLATIEVGAAGPADDSPMTIPAGKVGDKILYHSFMRNTSTEAWQPSGFAGYDVTDLTTTADRTGQVHDVLRVVEANGYSGHGADAQLEQITFVDLETKHILRLDFEFQQDADEGSFLFSMFGPAVFGEENGYVLAEPFSLQGQTYRLGQELPTDELREVVQQEAGYEDVQLDVKHWVAERAKVNGLDAYALRLEMKGSANGYKIASLEGGSAREASATDAIQWEGVQTTWVSHESPYPLLVEQASTFRSTNGESGSFQTLRTLAEYKPGTTPVPWGQDRATHHYRERNDDAQRTSGSQRYPADGTGSKLEYPLSAALASVNNDPTLLQFRLWRQGHPQAMLIGADYQSSSDTTGVRQSSWIFAFAEPDGDGYRITSERRSDLQVSRNMVGEEIKYPAFEASDFPAQPITIAAVEAVWVATASDAYAERVPNNVRWGRTFEQDENPDAFRQIEFGFSAMDSSPPLASEFQIRNANVKMFTDSGNIESYTEFGFKYTWQPLGTENQPRVVDVKPASGEVPIVFREPSIERAAVATGSLLAVFLAVYFLPLLKYGAAHALVFLPGYAKIRKDAILENRVRDQLLQLIKQDPGIHASDLGRRLDAGWGTVVYHLGVLEKNRLVSSLVDGRHKRFFPAGIIDFSRRGQIGVLRNDRTRSIYQMIAEEPGLIQGAIANRVGISVPATIWHLKRLEEVGLVGRDREGRKMHYYPADVQAVTGPAPADPKDSVEIV